MGGHFGGLQPPLRLSLPPDSSYPAAAAAAAAAAPRPSPDLSSPPKSHSGAGAGTLALSPEFLPSPRPAGAEQRRAGWRSGGAGSARGGRGGARRRGRAGGRREGGREDGGKEGERGEGRCLTLLGARGASPGPVAGQPPRAPGSFSAAGSERRRSAEGPRQRRG